jgi:hypothetical protein
MTQQCFYIGDLDASQFKVKKQKNSIKSRHSSLANNPKPASPLNSELEYQQRRAVIQLKNKPQATIGVTLPETSNP